MVSRIYEISILSKAAFCNLSTFANNDFLTFLQVGHVRCIVYDLLFAFGLQERVSFRDRRYHITSPNNLIFSDHVIMRVACQVLCYLKYMSH